MTSKQSNPVQITLSNWEHVFRDTLSVEVLRSEFRRALLLAGTLCVALGVSLGMAFYPEMLGLNAELRDSFHEHRPAIAGVIGVAIVYELLMAGLIAIWLRQHRAPLAIWPYLNACIEACIPTALVVVLCSMFDPVQGLISVPSMLYVVFILMATLQLRFWLSAFTGFVSAAMYLGVVWVYHDPVSVAELELVASFHHYVVRAILLLTCGVVSGVVARRIRIQLTASLRTIEERNRAVSIFGQHVSPEVARKLLHQHVETAGEMRHVCVMFLDIRDFSGFAATHPPGEVMDYLNTLFDRLIDIVNRNEGIINKFLGDGFMAVFGAPVEDNDHCNHAVRAALEMLEAIREMNEADEIPATRVGIGLHVGDAVTGNVGSRSRREYTIIGDVVNTASRIEQATKLYDASLLVSQNVHKVIDADHVKTDDVADLGEIELKGLSHPVHLFKLA